MHSLLSALPLSLFLNFSRILQIICTTPLKFLSVAVFSDMIDVVEGMACVANYINEMQRVSETYSSLFHTILSENSHTAPVRSSYLQFA